MSCPTIKLTNSQDGDLFTIYYNLAEKGRQKQQFQLTSH